MNFGDVIKRSLITEKATGLMENSQYSFQVAKKATKKEIRSAVEKIFKVKVKAVRTVMVRGKKRRALRTKKETHTSDWKKAIVQLAPGEKLDIFEQPETADKAVGKKKLGRKKEKKE